MKAAFSKQTSKSKSVEKLLLISLLLPLQKDKSSVILLVPTGILVI